MMRKVVAFAAVSSAAADLTCSVDASGVVSDGLNSALAIWASEKRCQGQWLSLSPVKCTTDVSSAIASVTHMAGTIAGMIQDCDGVKDQNGECAVAATNMVSDIAGLTAAGATITNKCGDVANSKWNGDVLGLKNDLGKCTADVGGSINGIFAASNTFEKMKANCADGKCPVTVEDTVSVLASLGSAIAAAVGDCNHYLNPDYDASTGDCVGAILDGVSAVTNAAKQGKAMQDKCKSSERLYSQTAPVQSSTPALTALLVALPVTAVLSFSVGRRVAKKQQVEESHLELGLESGSD